MENYLVLIRKSDFVDLFKYGFLYVNNEVVREFSCPKEELSEHKVIFDDLVECSNAFESTFTYVILHYSKGGSPSKKNEIKIDEVQGIYPLDNEAKIELQETLDPRIKINEPIWDDAVFKLQKKRFYKNCIEGVWNVRKIFKIDYDYSGISTIIKNEYIETVVEELFNNERPKGNLSLWIYLLRYERHAYFPKTTIGYFMDVVNVVCNYLNHAEVTPEAVEGTNAYKYLQGLGEQQKFSAIYDSIYNSEEWKNIFKHVDSKDCNFIKIAALFLFLKDEFGEGIDMSGKKKIVEYSKAEMNAEFCYAAYLLGIVLGYDKTYDCLYDSLPLPLFKKSIIELVNETYVEDKGNNEEIMLNSEIKENCESSSKPFTPVEMFRPKKGKTKESNDRNDFYKKTCEANSEEEKKKLEGKGYCQKIFNKKQQEQELFKTK